MAILIWTGLIILAIIILAVFALAGFCFWLAIIMSFMDFFKWAREVLSCFKTVDG